MVLGRACRLLLRAGLSLAWRPARRGLAGSSYRELEGRFRTLEGEIREGYDTKAIALHAKRGRMLVRDRLRVLLDEGAPFLEFGLFASHEQLPGIVTPAGGIVTGIGLINGVRCVVVANDPTVKGGTYFPATTRKHLRAQEIALQTRIPCVYIVDSGGGYLPLQSHGFADKEMFGRIFFNQANMSAAGIPQLSAVLGPCTAGGAYIPCLCDETIILRRFGHIYLAGPPLVKAATGEVVTPEALGGAELHCRVSGVCDHLADTEEQALLLCRSLVDNLNAPACDSAAARDLPAAQPEALDLIPEAVGEAVDLAALLRLVADNGRLTEFKSLYGAGLTTGFIRIGGHRAGVVASTGAPLCDESALKGTHFVQLCEQRGLPMVFLQDVPQGLAGSSSGGGAGLKGVGKLIAAVATASVPKITVLVGGSYGATNFALAGRSFSPNFLFTWPRATLGLDDCNTINALRANALSFCDGVVYPEDTRRTLAFCLATIADGQRSAREHRERLPTQPVFPVFRM